MGSQDRKESRWGGAGTQQARREGCEAPGDAGTWGGRSAEGQAGRGAEAARAARREGDAHPGHRTQERARAAHAVPGRGA